MNESVIIANNGGKSKPSTVSKRNGTVSNGQTGNLFFRLQNTAKKE